MLLVANTGHVYGNPKWNLHFLEIRFTRNEEHAHGLVQVIL